MSVACAAFTTATQKVTSSRKHREVKASVPPTKISLRLLVSLFLPLINPATPSARNISQIRSVIVTVCVNIPLYSMNGKLSFDVLRWDASIEWGHTYVLGPPPHTTPFPMTPPLLSIIYMFAFFPDVSNSCNICQVINAGCWKGEGIIWELMTCVTKQYCVLWHFAWLICVFNHSTLSPYPQALPFGHAHPPPSFLRMLHPCSKSWLCVVYRVCR